MWKQIQWCNKSVRFKLFIQFFGPLLFDTLSTHSSVSLFSEVAVELVGFGIDPPFHPSQLFCSWASPTLPTAMEVLPLLV